MNRPVPLVTRSAIRYGLVGTFMIALVVVGFSIVAVTKWRGNDRQIGVNSSSAVSPESRAPATPRDSTIKSVCFVRRKIVKGKDRYSVYSRDLSSGKETELAEGTDPDLAPTGDAVVFMSGKHYEGPLADPIPPEGKIDPWRIKILDVRTGEVKDFGKLANVSAYNPRWSNDGTRIAFAVADSKVQRMDMGILDPATGDWQNVTKDLNYGGAEVVTFFDSWSPGDQSILFHSLEDLYEVSIDGTLLQRIPLTTLGSTGEISSATRFSLSFDRRYLLFDRMMDTSADPANETVSIFDFSKKKLLRVTSNSIEGREPVWLPSGTEILFTCLKRFARPYSPSICKIAIDGTSLSTLISNAEDASYSTK